VSAVPACSRRLTPAAIQYFFWSYPEWWSLALSCLAWTVMLGHRVSSAGTGVHHLSFEQEFSDWMVMVAAMMLPLTVDAVRATALRSLWRRRHRAIAGFLAGYMVPWLVAGWLVTTLRMEVWAHSAAAPAVAFLAAALWLLTPAHRRALAACHRTQPLAPVGWRADLDCLRFGGTIGTACVRSCWPLMVACALAGHGPIALAGGMAVGALERWPFRARTRAALLVTLGLSSYYLMALARR